MIPETTCPFCKNTARVCYAPTPDGRPPFLVMCDDTLCATGPRRATPAEAVEAWEQATAVTPPIDDDTLAALFTPTVTD